MFGGIDSTSFKIKHKKLNRLGKNIVKCMNENNLTEIGEYYEQ